MATLLIYVASYTAMSLYGCYVGSVYGLRQGPNGTVLVAPKWYSWAPYLFESNGKWNRGMLMTFSPLYYLDVRLWHKDDGSYSGKYPVRWHPADAP